MKNKKHKPLDDMIMHTCKLPMVQMIIVLQYRFTIQQVGRGTIYTYTSQSHRPFEDRAGRDHVGSPTGHHCLHHLLGVHGVTHFQ